MASTNKTTNYELSQFVETDRPAWLTDYNGDMRTIDSTMKAISDVASGASGSISALADRMSTAEGNITTNTNDIATLDARADSLEAQAQSTAGTIANIQTEQTAQNLGIEAATELGYNLARPYDSASTYAVGDYVLFQNTLYKCITAVPVGEAFDATKWIAIKATDEIAGGGYTLPIASASQLGGVKVGNGLSIDPVTGILSSLGEWTYTNDFITLPTSGDFPATYFEIQEQNAIYNNKVLIFNARFRGGMTSGLTTGDTKYCEVPITIPGKIFPNYVQNFNVNTLFGSYEYPYTNAVISAIGEIQSNATAQLKFTNVGSVSVGQNLLKISLSGILFFA